MPATILWATGCRNASVAYYGGNPGFKQIGRGNPQRWCLRIDNGAIYDVEFDKIGVAPRTTLAVGMLIGTTAARTGVLYVCEGATIHLRFDVNGTGDIVVYRGDGTTLLGTSSGAKSIPFDSDGNTSMGGAHAEFRIVLHDSAGTIDVRIDGTSVLALAAQDTVNGGTGTCDRVQVRGNGLTFFSDFVLTDNVDWLGHRAVIDLMPTADGTHLDGVASSGSLYQCVDDTAHSDSDSSYVTVSDSALPKGVSFGLESLPSSGILSVEAVVPFAKLRATDSPLGTGRLLVRSAATEQESADIVPGAAYAAFSTPALVVDPNTAAAWTAAAVDAMEVGWIRQT